MSEKLKLIGLMFLTDKIQTEIISNIFSERISLSDKEYKKRWNTKKLSEIDLIKRLNKAIYELNDLKYE